MIGIVIAGVITGIIGAMLGVGGGMFLIPVLVFGMHIPMHYAVATSILAVIATSSSVASTNVERGTANMRLGMTLEIATTSGAIVGGLTAGYMSSKGLELAFAVALLPTIVMMWLGREEADDGKAEQEISVSEAENKEHQKPPPSEEATGKLGGQYVDEGDGRTVTYRVYRVWAGMLISFVAGGLSGLLGTGGGAFHVPGLYLACGVPVKAAAATSNFMIGVTAAASAFLYYGRDQVIPGITAAAVLGVLIGSAIGSFSNRKVHSVLVRRLFAVLLAVLAIYMFYHVWSGDGNDIGTGNGSENGT